MAGKLSELFLEQPKRTRDSKTASVGFVRRFIGYLFVEFKNR
jgi:hypothetical protein